MDFWTLIMLLSMYNAYKKQLDLLPPGTPLPLPDIRFHDGGKVRVVHWSIENPLPGS